MAQGVVLALTVLGVGAGMLGRQCTGMSGIPMLKDDQKFYITLGVAIAATLGGLLAFTYVSDRSTPSAGQVRTDGDGKSGDKTPSPTVDVFQNPDMSPAAENAACLRAAADDYQSASMRLLSKGKTGNANSMYQQLEQFKYDLRVKQATCNGRMMMRLGKSGK